MSLSPFAFSFSLVFVLFFLLHCRVYPKKDGEGEKGKARFTPAAAFLGAGAQ